MVKAMRRQQTLMFTRKLLRDIFLQEPKKWLKKTLHVANVLLSLESNPHHADDMQVPLLCLTEGEVGTHSLLT